MLDDHKGGGYALAFVGAQFQAVSLLLHQGGHRADITRRLLVALGELGQLAGWMAFDAGRHGLAQRYFFTALRAAHTAGDRPLAAHILGDLSYQAAWRTEGHEAVSLGEAALHAAAGATATTRASVLGRLAYAYAVAGDYEGFARARRQARETFEDRRPGNDPAWVYYLDQCHLDAQAGYSMVYMARARGR